MTPIPASLIAMIAAWALPLLVLAAGQLISSGYTTDVGSSAIWVGVFSLLAWGLFVVPALQFWKNRKLLCDPRWSWLGWTLLAIASYTCLTTWFMGLDAFEIIWYPAVMGCIAGVTYARLVRQLDSRSK